MFSLRPPLPRLIPSLKHRSTSRSVLFYFSSSTSSADEVRKFDDMAEVWFDERKANPLAEVRGGE